ncbi:hypothetical protein [Mesorhizobium loti]|uniref:hypothetical protein n=1 Tax=Rhizobium loti TaxID=381 RepID=UPI0012BD2585|nr:hypothetical protein [Mesorhizobium loti]
MAGSMADKQAAEQLKNASAAGRIGHKRLPCRRMRDFLAKSALSRMRRFPVAD